MSFGESIVLVASVLGWLIAVAIGIRIPERMREARERVEQAVGKKDRLARGIEEVRNAVEKLKDDKVAIEQQIVLLQSSMDEYKARLADAMANPSARLIVANDRWSPADRAWMADVSNPEFGVVRSSSPHAAALAAGRRHVVWAMSPRQALDRFAARYPPTKGWQVANVQEVDLSGPSAR
jgi:hypothetical protein